MTESRPALEQGFECGQNAPDQIRHLKERFDQRLTLDNPRLAERYLKGEFQIILRFGSRGYVDGEHMALLKRKGIRALPDDEGKVSAHEKGAILDKGLFDLGIAPEDNSAEYASHGHYQAVLVDVVQPIENPEGVIPTLVGLDCVNCVDCIRPHSLCYSWRVGFVLLGGVEDWERYVARTSRIAATDEKQLIREVIKGAPQVGECVSGDQRDQGRGWRDPAQTIGDVSALRVLLGIERIEVRSSIKGSDEDISVKDVLFGPFNFEPGRGETFGDCHVEVGIITNGRRASQVGRRSRP
jgi:hypothetical protein